MTFFSPVLCTSQVDVTWWWCTWSKEYWKWWSRRRNQLKTHVTAHGFVSQGIRRGMWESYRVPRESRTRGLPTYFPVAPSDGGLHCSTYHPFYMSYISIYLSIYIYMYIYIPYVCVSLTHTTHTPHTTRTRPIVHVLCVCLAIHLASFRILSCVNVVLSRYTEHESPCMS